MQFGHKRLYCGSGEFTIIWSYEDISGCIEAIRRLTGQCYIWSMHIKAEYRQGSILKHLDRQCPPSFLSIISEGFKKILNVGLLSLPVPWAHLRKMFLS